MFGSSYRQVALLAMSAVLNLRTTQFANSGTSANLVRGR